MTNVVHPSLFETEVEPSVKENRNLLQYDFDALVARLHGVSFLFVDYLYESYKHNRHGAIGTAMRAVSTEEAVRREEEYRDPNQSPYYWKYEQKNPAVSWQTWINSQLRKNEKEVIYDTAFESLYGDRVRDLVVANNLLDEDEIYTVECIYGGNIGGDLLQYSVEDFEQLYDEELWRLVQIVQENGLKDLYPGKELNA